MTIKKIFGIDTEKRVDVPTGLRGSGVTGGSGIFDEYFNQIIFETQADHIINTEVKVKQATPVEGTAYFNSTSGTFQDKDDVDTVILAGDKIAWAGLDTITANIDISAIDDLTHIMFQGITVALGVYSLSLGENQIGEFKYSGTASALSGRIQLIDVNSTYENFSTKDLIINVQSNTTVDADASSISFLNVSPIPTIIYGLNTTFDMTTDRIEGTGTTNKLSSTIYQMWIDSLGTKKLAPDLVSTTDGTTASKLVDSTADFVTYLVQIGDIVYNTTDLTQTTVTAIDDLNTLSIADDIFVSGETYKIRMLSPVGLGEFKARIGATYNNISSNLDDSTYTQIQEYKFYSEAAGDFAVTGTNWTTEIADIKVYQENNWTGLGQWKVQGNISGDLSGAAAFIILTTPGVTYLSGTNQAAGAACIGATGATGRTISNTETVRLDGTGSQAEWAVEFNVRAEKKPSYHN